MADEAWGQRQGFAVVGDVGYSKAKGAISVPRRRVSAYHWAEVLHEVAHLEMWRWTNKSPACHDDLVACILAADIAKGYGFGPDTMEYLHQEIDEQRASVVAGGLK